MLIHMVCSNTLTSASMMDDPWNKFLLFLAAGFVLLRKPVVLFNLRIVRWSRRLLALTDHALARRHVLFGSILFSMVHTLLYISVALQNLIVRMRTFLE
jgi:hypothetical protein